MKAVMEGERGGKRRKRTEGGDGGKNQRYGMARISQRSFNGGAKMENDGNCHQVLSKQNLT
jgi:hypothetical protein